ncbi:hypothetical protein PFTANZ_02706 [Plasmodium falciparum Tanzania (2000708)]|uniref:Uncharacterized protein n=2 Tax=Plasmodium falciparum TaxID=5833 RepID=A0A024W7A2_PLAFA|nr:hypothetical protein PFTANZ_02706 [Plasmodium falciparum Tanzania (2000708)]ETW42911.1 hypothetical protein PFNF135_02805 [Plasmodium falciparum NF135/5.C10]
MKQRYNKKKNKIKINYFFFIYYENVSNIYYPQIIQNFMHTGKRIIIYTINIIMIFFYILIKLLYTCKINILRNLSHQFKSLREYGINIIYKYIFKYFNKIYHFIKVLNIEMTKFYLCIFKMK